MDFLTKTLTFYLLQTEFRWYWMECKFREDMPLASQRSGKNPCAFLLAPRFKCTLQSFQEVFSKEPDFEVSYSVYAIYTIYLNIYKLLSIIIILFMNFNYNFLGRWLVVLSHELPLCFRFLSSHHMAETLHDS